MRGGRLAPAEPRHQVEAQLQAGAHHVLAGGDQVTAGAAFVDRHEDLVGARLEAQVHPGQARASEQRKLLRSASRKRRRSSVRRHALDGREPLPHATDHGRQLLGLHGAGVRVLQEDRAASPSQEQRDLVGLLRHQPAVDGPHPSFFQHLGGGGHRVHVAEHVLQRPERRPAALVHRAEGAAVPGAVADHPHQEAVRLARRADGTLLERRSRWAHALSSPAVTQRQSTRSLRSSQPNASMSTMAARPTRTIIAHSVAASGCVPKATFMNGA